MIVDGMKKCSKCGEVKSLEEFSKSSKHKTGRRSECKACVKKYNDANKDKIAERCHKYHETHKEEKREYDRKYRVRNRERINEMGRLYRSRPERKKKESEYKKQYNIDHVNEIKLYTQQYFINHKDEKRIWLREYRKTPNGKATHSRAFHKRRCKNSSVKNTLNARQWEKILERQNCACDDCNREFNEKLKPTKDHAIPLHFKWFGLTYGNTRALCRSCNSKKYNHTYFMKWAYELSPEALNGITTNSTSTNS